MRHEMFVSWLLLEEIPQFHCFQDYQYCGRIKKHNMQVVINGHSKCLILSPLLVCQSMSNVCCIPNPGSFSSRVWFVLAVVKAPTDSDANQTSLGSLCGLLEVWKLSRPSCRPRIESGPKDIMGKQGNTGSAHLIMKLSRLAICVTKTTHHSLSLYVMLVVIINGQLLRKTMSKIS